MDRARSRRLFPVLFLLLTLGLGGTPSSVVQGQDSTPTPNRVYLPNTVGNVIPKTIFGIDITQATPERNLGGARNIGANFVRRGNLPWKDVEPVEGAGYNWAAPSMAFLEAEMRNISALGMETIVVVRGSPRWATAPYQSDCAPINPAKYARFAAFVAAAVDRYSRPPYKVKYWELFNEPDVAVGPDSGFGCWGITSDPFYGGGAYGEMLKAVYPAIKAANPQVQVMNGSLLLDKPSTAPRAPARFFEGILRAGAGNSFDVLGYHSYCYYENANNPDGIDARRQPCIGDPTGQGNQRVDWKVSFLRKVLDDNRVPRKPMLNTEVALMCAGGADCRQAQADWVGRNFARALRDGIAGNIWFMYDSDGFRSTALVEPGNPFVTRPAYTAFKQASLMMGESQYLGDLGGQPDPVEGHRFGRNGEVTTIVWSNTQRTAKIPVGAGVVPTCLGRDGQVIACQAVDGVVSLTVGRSPVYVIGR